MSFIIDTFQFHCNSEHKQVKLNDNISEGKNVFWIHLAEKNSQPGSKISTISRLSLR